MAELSYLQLKQEVHEKVPEAAIADISTYIEPKTSSLWGYSPRDVTQRLIYVTIYKDLENIGFERLLTRFKSTLQCAKRTLEHNVSLIRPLLAEWGRSQIQLGKLSDWKAAARTTRKGKKITDVHLWIDSVDFPRVKDGSVYSKDHYTHSFKLDGAGRRFMTVQDAHGVILKVWGGYSPKLHDGSFLDLFRLEFLEYFAGASMIGDNHFAKGRRLFGNSIVFHTNYAIRKTNDPPPCDPDQYVTEEVVEAKKAYNKEHSTVRGKVEAPYGRMKLQFAALDNAFAESEFQQDCLVYFAFGLNNWMKRHS
jgi:hypothetical protein